VLSLPVKTHSYLPVILVPPVKGATITPNPIRVAVLFTQPRDYVSPRKKKKKSRLKGVVWRGTVVKQEKRIFSWHRLAS